MDEERTLGRYLGYLATPVVVLALVPLAVVLAAILYLFSIFTGLTRLAGYLLSLTFQKPAHHVMRGPHFHEVRVSSPSPPAPR